MAKALELRGSTTSPAYSLRSVRTLRLALGLITLFGASLFFIGSSWDIQWHLFVGRDRTLIPPHIMVLVGVGISGIAALSAVLTETLWARRSPAIADKGIHFADAFHGSLGAYIAGFGALAAGIAFPLDSYWHALYGIDVSIWAPFHIMFAVGMAIAAFGSAYMLLSAGHLAKNETTVQEGAKRTGYIGAAAALAIMMSIFTLLLFNAYGRMGTFQFGTITVNVFMLLASLLGTWVFVTAAYALPWRWSATAVMVISLLFVAIVFFYVPFATELLLKVENLSYLAGGLHPVVIILEWPFLFLVSAIIIDIAVSRAKRMGWSSRRMILTVAACSLIGFLPMRIINLAYPLNLLQTSAVGFLISLLLGLIGGCIGTWLGQNVGRSLHTLER